MPVEVKITIVGGGNGVPFSFFDPHHPFVHRNCHHPLPYWKHDNRLLGKSPFGTGVSIIIEEELTIPIPSLDLKKAFNCFNQVPSVGAKYSIKLCVDVPNNDKPLQFPPDAGSETGHTFLVVKKWNGKNEITQVFGFYASQHPGYLFPLKAMPSVIKNNQLREINASVEMGLTEAQFEELRKKAFELARQKYAAANYNCTNFAMDLFNAVRAQPITVDSYVFYTNRLSVINPLTIDKSPQMLFKKLKQMKDSKNAEASYINIDQTVNTKAPLSHGECN